MTDNRSLVIVGPTTCKLPLVKSTIDDITGANESAVLFSDYSPTPKWQDVVKASEMFRSSGANRLVAIGGGTAMDLAKLVKYFVAQPLDGVTPEMFGKLEPQKIEFLAVPTTAGTGSEATSFAVLYFAGQKYSINHPDLLPNRVEFRPELLVSASAYLKACCGMDAFCQAWESMWSVGADDESIAYSREAINLLRENLLDFVSNESLDTAKKMQLAAHRAGQAINISKTTAAHAASYKLTSDFGIPHGHAVGMCLGFFILHNGAARDPNQFSSPERRGVISARIQELFSLIDASNAQQSHHWFVNFMDSLGLSRTIDKTVTSADISALAAAINIERLANNPVLTTHNDLLTLYRQIFTNIQ